MSPFTQLLLSSTLQPAAAESAARPLWRIILADIPRDASAIVVYALLTAVIWFIWWANRHSGDSRPGSATTEVAGPALHDAHPLRRSVDAGGTPATGAPRHLAGRSGRRRARHRAHIPFDDPGSAAAAGRSGRRARAR